WGGRCSASCVVHTPPPLWPERLVWFLILAGYLYYVILPWILQRRVPGLMSVFSNPFRRKAGATPAARLSHFKSRSFSNSLSFSIVTPNSFALSYFDSGSVPTTT